MQANKGVQMVLLLGAIFTCLAFLNKPLNITYKINKNNFLSMVNLNPSLHSARFKFNLISQERLRSEIQKRINNIENLCEKHNKTRQFDMVVSKMIIDEKHGISWCPIYKAASSAWMRQFARLRGIVTDETEKLFQQNLVQISTLVNGVYNNEGNTKETLKKMNKTKTFLMVRHPFERLLSAYRDKLEHREEREYYYRRFGRHITYKYRKNKNEKGTRLEPTFVEFLEFIVKEKYFDEHWIPYNDACLPCDIKYDFILKVETFEEESAFLLLELGLQGQLDFGQKERNSTFKSATTKSVIENYYKEVPVSLLKKIYSIYEIDFKLFLYKPEKYYLIGKNE